MKPKILYVAGISQFQKPTNGGQLRTHHVILQLAQEFKIDIYSPILPRIISFETNLEIINVTNFYTKCIAKILRLRIIGRLAKVILLACYQTKAPINSLIIERLLLNKFVKSKANTYDIILYDTLRLAPTQAKTNSKSKYILMAHNVDSVLPFNGKFETTIENQLSYYFDGVITCTSEDAIRFQKMNPGISTVIWPNGSTRPLNPSNQRRKTIDFLFVGSLDYAPNIEAIEHFIHNILHHLKDYRIAVAGRNPSQQLSNVIQQAGIQLLPNVPDLSEIYHQTCVSIVPLLSGSGSRLKIAESLLHGIPVVSTTIGAEGYPDVTGLYVLKDGDDEAFAATAKYVHEANNLPNRTDILQEAEQFLWQNTINPRDLHIFLT